jgi:hypothetical protein
MSDHVVTLTWGQLGALVLLFLFLSSVLFPHVAIVGVLVMLGVISCSWSHL